MPHVKTFISAESLIWDMDDGDLSDPGPPWPAPGFVPGSPVWPVLGRPADVHNVLPAEPHLTHAKVHYGDAQ